MQDSADKKALTGAVSESRLEMDGTYMNVIRFGTGKRAFVMLSGISLSGLEGLGEAIAQAYEILTKEYTVYVFDRKKVLPENYSTEDMSEDIYRALQMYGVKQADVYGVSHGGMMAQYLAINHPELVRRLVLCSTQARAGKDVKKVAQVWGSFARVRDVVGLNRYFFEQVYSEDYLFGFKDILPELEKIGTDADCKRFEVLAKAVADFDLYDRLDEVKCPALVLGSTDDKVIPVDSMIELAERLGCETYFYEGFGHAVYDEAPDIKGRIYDFCKE